MKLRHEHHPSDGRRRSRDVVADVPTDSPLGLMFANPGTLRITVTRTSGDEDVYTHLERLEQTEEAGE